MKNETKVVCPVCGTEMAIPNNTEIVTGVALGKDSNLGTVYLTPATCKNETTNKNTNKTSEKMKKKTAQERLDALKAKGVDVSNFFAVTNADGEGQIMKMDGGNLIPVDENDPVFLGIREGGYVSNYKLFRRWVLSQMFHMLNFNSFYRYGKGGFTEALKAKGYEYQWKMLINELHAQAEMERNGDVDNLEMRRHWFNKQVVVEMFDDYMEKLKLYIDALKVKRCKGVPYKTVKGRNIFLDDMYSKVYAPLYLLQSKIAQSTTVGQLEKAVREINAKRVPLKWSTPQCPKWMDAYKGSGAYFSLRNLIMFHGVQLFNHPTHTFLNTSTSLKQLDRLNSAYATEGWRMLGVLKETLAFNKIDIDAKIKSWRK